jgi:hypothetical protein
VIQQGARGIIGRLAPVCVLTAGLIVGPAPARAQEQTPPIDREAGAPSGAEAAARARRDFEEGLRRFNAGEYATAIQWFDAAYQLAPLPGLLYNLAQAHRLSGDCARALVLYRRYLATNPVGTNRARAESRVSDMERCARASDPAGATAAAAAGERTTELPPPAPTLTPPAVGATALPLATLTVPLASAPRAPSLLESPGPSAVRLDKRSDERESPGLTRRWWFWAAIGAVALGTAALTAKAAGVLDRDAGCPPGHRCM